METIVVVADKKGGVVKTPDDFKRVVLEVVRTGNLGDLLGTFYEAADYAQKNAAFGKDLIVKSALRLLHTKQIALLHEKEFRIQLPGSNQKLSYGEFLGKVFRSGVWKNDFLSSPLSADLYSASMSNEDRQAKAVEYLHSLVYTRPDEDFDPVKELKRMTRRGGRREGEEKDDEEDDTRSAGHASLLDALKMRKEWVEHYKKSYESARELVEKYVAATNWLSQIRFMQTIVARFKGNAGTTENFDKQNEEVLKMANEALSKIKNLLDENTGSSPARNTILAYYMNISARVWAEQLEHTNNESKLDLQEVNGLLATSLDTSDAGENAEINKETKQFIERIRALLTARETAANDLDTFIRLKISDASLAGNTALGAENVWEQNYDLHLEKFARFTDEINKRVAELPNGGTAEQRRQVNALRTYIQQTIQNIQERKTVQGWLLEYRGAYKTAKARLEEIEKSGKPEGVQKVIATFQAAKTQTYDKITDQNVKRKTPFSIYERTIVEIGQRIQQSKNQEQKIQPLPEIKDPKLVEEYESFRTELDELNKLYKSDASFQEQEEKRIRQLVAYRRFLHILDIQQENVDVVRYGIKAEMRELLIEIQKLLKEDKTPSGTRTDAEIYFMNSTARLWIEEVYTKNGSFDNDALSRFTSRTPPPYNMVFLQPLLTETSVLVDILKLYQLRTKAAKLDFLELVNEIILLYPFLGEVDILTFDYDTLIVTFSKLNADVKQRAESKEEQDLLRVIENIQMFLGDQRRNQVFLKAYNEEYTKAMQDLDRIDNQAESERFGDVRNEIEHVKTKFKDQKNALFANVGWYYQQEVSHLESDVDKRAEYLDNKVTAPRAFQAFNLRFDRLNASKSKDETYETGTAALRIAYEIRTKYLQFFTEEEKIEFWRKYKETEEKIQEQYRNDPDQSVAKMAASVYLKNARMYFTILELRKLKKNEPLDKTSYEQILRAELPQSDNVPAEITQDTQQLLSEMRKLLDRIPTAKSSTGPTTR